MNTVHERLQITPEQYSDLLFHTWLKWCGSKTGSQAALQRVLICNPLKNWWQAELAKYEAQFMETSEPYAHTLTKSDALKLWAEHTIHIYSKFSKTLIKKAYEPYSITQQN